MAEPTVIDSLIVTLGLDPTDFNTGRKKAAADMLSSREDAARTAKEMEARGKQAAQFYGSIKREALGLFAVVTGAGGLERFTVQTVNNFSAIGRAAQSMGLATSELSAFQNMIVRNGGSADAAKASLQGLSKSMQEWKALGNTAALPYLNRVRANANDSALQVYEKFSRYAPTVNAKTANMVGQGLGLDEASINQAMKGDAAYRAGMQKSRDLGVPSDDDVKKVTELQRAFLELRQAVTGDAQAMLEQAAPALAGLLHLATEGAEAFPGLVKGVLALGVAVSGLSAIKLGASLLRLLGIAAPAAEATAAAGGGLGLGALLGPAAAAYELFAPTQANKGEAAALAHARAPRPGQPGYDRDIAIRTLIGEARPGDFQGMKDVAHVIKNRMTLSGKGAADIALQPGQFEPWMKRKAELMAIRRDSPAYKNAERAWWDATQEADPTGGSTLFVSPGGQKANGRSMPAWATPEALKLARGGHQFYSGAFPGQKAGRTLNIGSVTVHTQATDAKGIAQGFQGELDRLDLANQMNTGLQ